MGSDVQRVKENRNAILREMIIEDGRIDILAKFILGFAPEPFHKEMIEWQSAHQEGLLLGWRGCAKTTFLTIARIIKEIIANPDIRILIACDAQDQAKTILRSVKSHFESNIKLREAFGDYHEGAKVWTETEITVNKRTAHYGEPTVMCAGIGTTLPSRHFDMIICDDLVTEDNSQTEGQRQKVHNYFYKTLLPTLMSPNGRLWVIGTRWHDEDLYGWLEKEDYADATLIVSALDEETDESRWEENFPTARLHRIRKGNPVAFELQYQCRSTASGAGIFSIEHFKYYDHLPDNVFKWQGVDLAIGQKSHNDFFAHVTIAVHKDTKDPYLIEYRKTRLTAPQQAPFVAKRWYANNDVVRVVLETNAYQVGLKQTMAAEYPDVPCVGRYTMTDKIARAQQVATILTDHPLHIRRGHHEFLRFMLGFPSKKGSKDLFDALEMALGQGLQGAKKKRRNEPGLL